MKSLSLPTVDSPRDFYLGGLYSLVLCVLIFVLFFQLLLGAEKIHAYAMQKSATITVSLTDVPVKAPARQPAEKPLPKPKQEPRSAPEPEPAPVEDISSLFSEIKTQKITQTKRDAPEKKVDQKRLSALERRIKTTEKRQPSATAEQVKQLTLVRPTQASGGTSASGGAEVDRYYAKIQATIYDHFFPPANSEGSVAQIRIWISADGRMTRYKVLRRSGDPFFDQEVDRLGERLRSAQFGPNPKGKETVLNVDLISKE